MKQAIENLIATLEHVAFTLAGEDAPNAQIKALEWDWFNYDIGTLRMKAREILVLMKYLEDSQ
jgi:hypothetical protein